MTLKMWIKRLGLKIRIKSRNHFSRDEKVEVSEYEKKALSLCRKLINESDSRLSMCPETNKRFIINDRLIISVIIKSTTIDFFDDYLHNIPLCMYNHTILLRIFDKHVAMKRLELENKMRANTKHSFNEMYDSVIFNKL